MSQWLKRFAIVGVVALFAVETAQAAINRVRVVNDTNTTVYIHQGGYAPSVKIAPGGWRIFYYPFSAVPPGHNKKVHSSMLIATAGGRWITTPNGFTYLSQPKLSICLDYQSDEHKSKTGNRVWTIQRADYIQPGCSVKGYKQPWYRDSNSNSNSNSNSGS